MDEWQKFTGESRSNTFPVEKLLQELAYDNKSSGSRPAASTGFGDD
jgi:hypothetical protein